jgi:hypothetical protein
MRGGILGSKGKIHRLVGIFHEHNEAFLSELVFSAKKKPKSKPPKLVALDMLREQLYREVEVVDECVRYPWMVWSDDRLAVEVPSAIVVRESAIARLAGLYSNADYQERGLLFLSRSSLHEATRTEAFKECAGRTGLKIRQIYKYVDRLLTYGPIANALLSHKKLCGLQGVRRLGGRRTGRPNAYAKKNPEHPSSGQVLTKYHVGKFRKALVTYFVKENMSLSETYRKMRLNLYVQRMPAKGGGYTDFPVHPGKIPSFEQFYGYYRVCRARGEFVDDKAGAAEYEKNRQAFAQSARDISDGPLDVFDVDGTGGKIELVATYHPDRLIGCPLVLLAVDRGSDAIVGACVTTFGESAETYKKCLFVAFTPKDSLLAKLDLPLHYWTEFGQCNAIFVDQGAGKSREIGAAFVNRLNRGRYIAPAGAPRAKALVEGINDKLHDWMASEEGAYDRTHDGERKAERRASAKKRARRTRREYWQKLVEFIYEHNTTTNVSHLLTPEMRADGVRGFPRDIFEWGKKQRRGAERQERSRSELARLLLERVERRVQEDGLHHNKRTFASTELLRLRDDHMSRNAHWAKIPPLVITVYPNPQDPNILYWESEPGKLTELFATTDSQRRTANMSYDDWLDCMEADRLSAIDGRNKLHGKTFLSRAQVDILRGVAKNRTAGEVRAQEIQANRALEQMFEKAEAEETHREALFDGDKDDEVARVSPEPQESPEPDSPSSITALAARRSKVPEGGAAGQAAKAQDEFDEAYAAIFGA